MTRIQEFFGDLWLDFTRMAPRAATIRDLFTERGEEAINDHVAFRTFNLPFIGIARLERRFLDIGYEVLDEYDFPEKNLRARSYRAQEKDAPLIFLSELLLEQIQPECRAIIEKLALQSDPAALSNPALFSSGRLWPPPSSHDYQTLLANSEYAAWVAALGFHANHFTISVNRLRKTTELREVLDLVEDAGFTINEAGGRIKGSPQELLEQGSTMAELVTMEFHDGEKREIPGCFYEFARRYPEKNGELFQGFIAKSANKIFESTWTKPESP